jgi:DNA-binding transcriptional LysR family regulator
MEDGIKFNFNLLYPFYILHDEKNVTRAGKRLDVTQSAMSNSLNQMRKQFDDQLFIRGKYGMRPTERADEIAAGLKPILEEVDALVNEESNFNPTTTTREFIVAFTTTMSYMFCAEFTKAFRKAAPNARLTIHNCHHFLYDQNANDQKGIELLVGMNCQLPTTALSEHIMKASQIVVARKDHPLMQEKLTLNKYLKAKHLLVIFSIAYSTFQRRKSNLVDETLTQKGLSRNIAISVSSQPRVVPAFLINSDLLAIVPERFFDKLNKRNQFISQPIPFKIPPVKLGQVWHNRYENDPGHHWLRSLVKKVINNDKV